MGEETESKKPEADIKYELNWWFLVLAIFSVGGMITLPISGRFFSGFSALADPILILITFVILSVPGVYAIFRIYLPENLSEWTKDLRYGKKESGIDEIRQKAIKQRDKKRGKEESQLRFRDKERKKKIKKIGKSQYEREEKIKERRLSKRKIKGITTPSKSNILKSKRKVKRKYYKEKDELNEWYKTLLAEERDIHWKPNPYKMLLLATTFFILIFGGFFLVDYLTTNLWQVESFMGRSIQGIQYFMTNPFAWDPLSTNPSFNPEDYPILQILLNTTSRAEFWFLLWIGICLLIWSLIDEWFMASLTQRNTEKARIKELERKMKITDKDVV
ncbi:MAG: hypothetical protein ACTSUV_03220 [Candidatus Ranarchaeia archaeon]